MRGKMGKGGTGRAGGASKGQEVKTRNRKRGEVGDEKVNMKQQTEGKKGREREREGERENGSRDGRKEKGR